MAEQKKPMAGLNELEVYDETLNLLAIRDHSVVELKRKLIQKGCDEALIPVTINKLMEYGFLNDERYADRVLEYWLHKGPYGHLHLEAELYKRGLSKELIRSTVKKFTAEDEAERAELAVSLFINKNHKKIALAKDRLSQQKIVAQGLRFLAARGFGPGQSSILLNILRFDSDMD